MGKKRAKEHYDFIKEQYCKEIDNSITNTAIHACESIEARIPQYQRIASLVYSLQKVKTIQPFLISPVIKSPVDYISKGWNRRKKAYSTSSYRSF